MISKLLRRNRCGWNWSWRVRKDIEAHEKIIGKKLNRDEVIEYLFGDFNQYPETNLDIYLL